MKTNIQNIKAAIIDFVRHTVKSNITRNTVYEQIANQVWREKIAPYVINEEITTWESDIKKKFIDNPYVRFDISEKQAFCLARAFANINPDTFE